MALHVDVARDWLDYLTAVGTVGATLAAAGAAIVALRQARQDRVRRLHIWAGTDMHMDESFQPVGDVGYRIEATNVSRRPITVLSAGFEAYGGVGFGVSPVESPAQPRLQEGDTAEWWFRAEDINRFIESGMAIHRVWVRERQGVMHYARYGAAWWERRPAWVETLRDKRQMKRHAKGVARQRALMSSDQRLQDEAAKTEPNPEPPVTSLPTDKN